jgi:hypothetical protein
MYAQTYLRLGCAFLQESPEFLAIRSNLGSKKKELRSFFAGTSRKSGTDREGMLKNMLLFCRNPFSLAKCLFTPGLVNPSFQVSGCDFWPIVRLFCCHRRHLLYHCRRAPLPTTNFAATTTTARYIPGVSSLLLSLMHHCQHWHRHFYYCCHRCHFRCCCCFRCRCCRRHRLFFQVPFS